MSAEPTDCPPEPASAVAPESCANNLHRRPDNEGATPEATQLCKNDVGVIHMMDCPLFLGRPCTYYEAADEPHPVANDAALRAANAELRHDFLGWAYTRRVRALSQPRGWLPEPLAVEPIDEPEHEPGEELALAWRAPPPDEETPEPEPEEQGPELYPGQRRAEDRRRQRRPAPATPSDGESAVDEAEEGEDDAPAEPPPPRTVEELLADLPEAHLPEERTPKKKGDGGRPRRRGRRRGPARGGGPRQAAGEKTQKKPDGKPSRQRRRGRRGGPKTGAASGGQSGQSGEGGEGAKKADAGASGGGRGRRRRRRRPPRKGGDAPPKKSD